MLDRALLYLRTVKRMRPGMVVSRLRRQRMLSERVLMGEHCIVMPHIAISDLDLDIRY